MRTFGKFLAGSVVALFGVIFFAQSFFEFAEFFFKEPSMTSDSEYCSYENRSNDCVVENLPDKFFYLGNENGGSYAYIQVAETNSNEEVIMNVEIYASYYEENGYYSRVGRKSYEGTSILISPDGISFDVQSMKRKLTSQDFTMRLFDPEETNIWVNGGDKIFFRLPETGFGIWSIVPIGF